MEIFLIILWLISSAGSIAQSTYYWQLKEYRLDRMREFLIQQQGHQIFLTIYHVLLLVLLLAYLLIITVFQIEGYFQHYFPMMVGTLFLAESLKFGHQVFIRRFRRPKPTKKAILILLLTLLIEAGLFFIFFYLNNYVLELLQLSLILALLSFVDQDINALAILIMNVLGKVIKKRIYKKARDKRLRFTGLKVVGITGSFGKTSVKEYIYHLLSGKYRVLKTEKNTNTEMGIANTILKKLKQSHEIFVCEMGAYSSGEVKQCCYMAHPQTGVFTGLNEQHLALFKTLDNTFLAKWELITSLPQNGLAVINGDSVPLRTRIKKYSGTMVICSIYQGDAVAEQIEVTQSGLSFIYKGQKFESSLIGDFQVVNLLMSIVVAEKLGLSLTEIAQRIETLEAPEKTMKVIEFERGLLIDDSYNVNTDGFSAALKHLDLFEDHIKVVFFPGILELGDESYLIHQQLGALIAEKVDYAFFTDPLFAEYLERGALENGLTRDQIRICAEQEELTSTLKSLLKKHQNRKFVILFESRGAEKVMAALR